MHVSLSDKTAPAQWGENALLSTTAEGLDIHLAVNQEQIDRTDRIQQAARKVSVMGVLEISLTGLNWTLEDQWAFALGYLKVKNCGVIQWAETASEDSQELNDDERWQFGSLMMAMFCDFNQHYNMHKQKRLDPEFWRSIDHNMKFYIDRPGVLTWWQTQPFMLDAGFTNYINEHIASRQNEIDGVKPIQEDNTTET